MTIKIGPNGPISARVESAADHILVDLKTISTLQGDGAVAAAHHDAQLAQGFGRDIIELRDNIVANINEVSHDVGLVGVIQLEYLVAHHDYT